MFCFHEGLWGRCRSWELIDPNLLARPVLVSAPGHRPGRSPLKTEPTARAGRTPNTGSALMGHSSLPARGGHGGQRALVVNGQGWPVPRETGLMESVSYSTSQPLTALLGLIICQGRERRCLALQKHVVRFFIEQSSASQNITGLKTAKK